MKRDRILVTGEVRDGACWLAVHTERPHLVAFGERISMESAAGEILAEEHLRYSLPYWARDLLDVESRLIVRGLLQHRRPADVAEQMLTASIYEAIERHRDGGRLVWRTVTA